MSLEDIQSQLKKDATREANNRLKPEYRPHVEMGASYTGVPPWNAVLTG